MQTNHDENLYKTGTISQLTGFSPTLLRVWERRYGFLAPRRSASGHRLYTENDLQVLERVRLMLDQGYSVGQAAVMGRSSLLHTENPERASRTIPNTVTEDLQIHRTERYGGEDLGVSIRELNPSDLATLCRLYDLVKRIHEVWLYMSEVKNEKLLIEKVKQLAEPSFVSSLSQLGYTVSEEDTLLKAALEDARWGALGPLLAKIPKADAPWSSAELAAAVLLARDHAKMLRNAFYDLDATLREADESPKAHSAKGSTAKFRGLQWDTQRVELLASWDGALTSRCLETSAVDRLLYDFLRRAHKIGCQSVYLHLVKANSQLVRFVFDMDRPGFKAHQEKDLASLAVGRSVGLSPAAALRQGYLGARGEGKGCCAWFHWPIFYPPSGTKVCDCEH